MPSKISKISGWKQTDSTVFERGQEIPVLITVGPRCLTLRPKGSRSSVSMPYASIYAQAARAEADVGKKQPPVKRNLLSL
jgi:hypothetical protein